MLTGNNWLSKQWLVSSDLEIHWFGDPLALMCYSVIAGICKIVTMGRTLSRTRKSTERTTTKQQQQRRRCFGKWQLPSKLSLCMSLSSWPMTLIIRKQGSQVWRSTSLGIHSSSSQCSFEGARSSIEANGIHWFGDPLALMCYSVIAGICKIVTMGRTSSRTRKSTKRTTTATTTATVFWKVAAAK